MASNPHHDDTPSIVKYFDSSLKSVRDAAADLVTEIDAVTEQFNRATKRTDLRLVDPDEGELMECAYCGEEYRERRDPEMPCYGTCSKACFKALGGEDQ